MDREKIRTMPAGLELDMLVGQFVIGFDDYLKEKGKRPVVRDGRYGKNYFDLPAYSIEISAAWEVVEKMRTTHKQFITIIDNPHLNYDVRFSGAKTSEYERLSNLPHAICRAALLALN